LRRSYLLIINQLQVLKPPFITLKPPFITLKPPFITLKPPFITLKPPFIFTVVFIGGFLYYCVAIFK